MHKTAFKGNDGYRNNAYRYSESIERVDVNGDVWELALRQVDHCGDPVTCNLSVQAPAVIPLILDGRLSNACTDSALKDGLIQAAKDLMERPRIGFRCGRASFCADCVFSAVTCENER